jgi:hypothetical protein
VLEEGSFRELVTHGYLPAVSDQGRGYVESFGSFGLRTRFHQAILHSEGAHQSSHHYSLAMCGYHLILAITRLEGRGTASGSRSDTASCARRSFWRPSSTDAPYARRMSSPKMNSFVILVTNTKIFSGHRPSVSDRHYLQDRDGFPRYRLQPVALIWLSFGPSGGDVGPGRSPRSRGMASHVTKRLVNKSNHPIQRPVYKSRRD